jgi:hypothetical protein
MTPEQIEEMRPKRIDDELNEHMNALCDLALKGLQVEAMREAIVLNVGRMRNDMKMRGYLSVGTLTSALDDLSQSLNPKNEEGKTAAAPDELRKAYFEGYEDALKDRSAHAEVAEGAGEDRLTDEECRIAQIYESARDSYPGHQESAGTLARACLRLERALRAAPSLSREEWRMLDWHLPNYIQGTPGYSVTFEALRAKVREAAKSRP